MKAFCVKFCAIVALAYATMGWAESANVVDFRISYRFQDATARQAESLKGVQRAAELQSAAGETLTHRRTLKDGTHEMRASRTMTRVEAWALAEKLQRANPGIGKVEPVDPEGDLVQGARPTERGVKP